MMIEKYSLADEPGKTMFVFPALGGKIYGHIIRDRTAKDLAKLIFETPRYDSVEALKADFPEATA